MMHQALNAQALYYDIVGNKVIIRACIMYSEMKGWAVVVNRWAGNPSDARRRQLLTALTLAVSTRAGIENSVTVAKQKQLPSAGLDIMRTARPQNTT